MKRVFRACDICYREMNKEMARGDMKIFYIAKVNWLGSCNKADICGECLREIAEKVEEKRRQGKEQG